MEVGIVKSFGRGRDGQSTSYGWIERQGTLAEYLKLKRSERESRLDLGDIFVHKTQLPCPEEDLRKGVFVIFEVGVNPKKGKEEARNVNLFREIGIVKWFGGRNSKTNQENDFGFIERLGADTFLGNKDDLWVHISQVNGLESQLKEGTLVTFGMLRNPQLRNNDVFDVRLLSPEDEIIEHYLNIPDRRIWSSNSVKEYLVKLPEKKAVSLVINAFYALENTQRQHFADSLPPEILARYSARPLRNALAASRHFELCIEMLNALENTPIKPELKEEILTTGLALSEFGEREESELNSREGLHWEKVPKSWYKDEPVICEFLPSKLRIPLIVEQFFQTEDGLSRGKLLDELAQRLQQSSRVEWDTIPLTMLLSDKIWPLIPQQVSVTVVLREVEQESACSLATFERVVHLLNTLPTSYSHGWYSYQEKNQVSRTDLIGQLPDWIKLNKSVFPHLTVKEQVSVLVKQLESEDKIQDSTIHRLAEILASVSPEKLPDFLKQIPAASKQHEALFRFFEPVEQVDLVWSALTKGSITEWSKLSWQAKVLCIYRATKEDIRLLQVEKLIEEHPLVEGVLTLLRAKYNSHLKNSAFHSAHTLFQDYVIQQAWQSKDPLKLTPLLPPCKSIKHIVAHLEYCEATPWDVNKDGKNLLSYCPRLGNAQCDVPRLEANPERDWQNWSLSEFITSTGIDPILREMHFSSAGHYVTKLAGWVNRLNEIRSRLRCSHCQEIMMGILPYAKNLARYNSTVFSCQRGEGHDRSEGHDRGVYLSHCWACWGINPKTPIIDSREGSVCVESDEIDPRTGNVKSYYLCIFCGSGPPKSTWFTQGDYCPKCKTPQMVRLSQQPANKKSAGVMRCRACRHRIELPRAKDFTEPK